jgi:hypothetical protein
VPTKALVRGRSRHSFATGARRWSNHESNRIAALCNPRHRARRHPYEQLHLFVQTSREVSSRPLEECVRNRYDSDVISELTMRHGTSEALARCPASKACQ